LAGPGGCCLLRLRRPGVGGGRDSLGLNQRLQRLPVAAIDPADQFLAVDEGCRVGVEQGGVEARGATGLVRPGGERPDPAPRGAGDLLRAPARLRR